MPHYQTCVITSTANLRAAHCQWDDLWLRSETASPTARASLVAQWIDHFAARATLRAVVISEGDRWVAALPLISSRLAPLLRIGRLPDNFWSAAGDLLLDPTADAPKALDALVRKIARLPWPLVGFDGINWASQRWSCFREALDRGGLEFAVRDCFEVGQVQIQSDWESYFKSRSRNHRRHMRTALAKAAAKGGLAVKVADAFDSDSLAAQLLRGFQVEDRSWKGAEGTSVLRSAGILDFFKAQAQQLAAYGHLRLVFLEINGTPVAFEYGYQAKGIYFTPKVGYDQAYQDLSPGQLLRLKLLEELHGNCHSGQLRVVDYMGPLSDATAKWTTTSYPVKRLMVATHHPLGRPLLRTYERVGRSLRSVRDMLTQGRAVSS